MDKIEQLRKLGRLRRAQSPPVGCKDISTFWGGKYDSDFVTPITKSACNVDSPIAFVLHDWSSSEHITKSFDPFVAQYGYTERLPTNVNLQKLLRRAYSLGYKDVFINNLFPYIKEGPISAPIRRDFLDWAFNKFCWPEIQIVRPQFVVCLGFDVYKAFARNLKGEADKITVGDHFRHQDITVYCQSSPGSRGVQNRGGIEKVSLEWQAMRAIVRLG